MALFMASAMMALFVTANAAHQESVPAAGVTATPSSYVGSSGILLEMLDAAGLAANVADYPSLCMFDCPNCCKDDKSPYYGKCLYDEVYLRTCDSKNAQALNEATSQSDSTLSAELCPCDCRRECCDGPTPMYGMCSQNGGMYRCFNAKSEDHQPPVVILEQIDEVASGGETGEGTCECSCKEEGCCSGWCYHDHYEQVVVLPCPYSQGDSLE